MAIAAFVIGVGIVYFGALGLVEFFRDMFDGGSNDDADGEDKCNQDGGAFA